MLGASGGELLPQHHHNAKVFRSLSPPLASRLYLASRKSKLAKNLIDEESPGPRTHTFSLGVDLFLPPSLYFPRVTAARGEGGGFRPEWNSGEKRERDEGKFGGKIMGPGELGIPCRNTHVHVVLLSLLLLHVVSFLLNVNILFPLTRLSRKVSHFPRMR